MTKSAGDYRKSLNKIALEIMEVIKGYSRYLVREPSDIPDDVMKAIVEAFMTPIDSIKTLHEEWITYRKTWIHRGTALLELIRTRKLNKEIFYEFGEALYTLESLLDGLRRFDEYGRDLQTKLARTGRLEKHEKSLDRFWDLLTEPLISKLEHDLDSIKTELQQIVTYSEQLYGEQNLELAKQMEKSARWSMGASVTAVGLVGISILVSLMVLL